MQDFSWVPEGFAWGVATSAYQVEGAVAEDGRGPSIWDTFTHTAGRIVGGATGDVACDHYHRWRDDIAIMRSLGVTAYRFSVAWPRVVPDGAGTANGAGLDFYDRLVDALLAAGIAPGITDLRAAVDASYHLLLGHGLATQAIRARSSSARVGLVNALTACEPAGSSGADAAAAVRYDGHANRWWIDPLYGRGFPADMLAVYGVDLPEHAGDLATIATPLDWLGVNYYSPSFVTDDPAGPVPHVRVVRARDGAHQTMLGWEVRADGLEQILVRLSRDYGAGQLYVTENGSAWPDTVAQDGQVHDQDRVRYLDEHLAACGRAVRQGVPLARYFAWSLMDNFEWAEGYAPRFGIVFVDFTTQRRIIKDSGHRYADIIRSGRAEGARTSLR